MCLDFNLWSLLALFKLITMQLQDIHSISTTLFPSWLPSESTTSSTGGYASYTQESVHWKEFVSDSLRMSSCTGNIAASQVLHGCPSLKQWIGSIIIQIINQREVNPLTPMSDHDRISPYIINTVSSIQVIRIKKNVN